MLEAVSSAANLGWGMFASELSAPLSKGLDLLSGGDQPPHLEVGIASTVDRPMTGWWVVARAPRGELDLTHLKVAEDRRLVLSDGSPLAGVSYLVIEVQASSERKDWESVTELGNRYRAIQDELRGHARPDVVWLAFADWARAMQVSPDMQYPDSRRLIAHAKQLISEILEGPVAGGPSPVLPRASEL
jgi:hypothetical protein